MHTHPHAQRALRSKLALVLVSIVSVVVVATAAQAYRAGFVDDTYIFLRYAENIAAGNGAVFNVGEHVEGYTSPLWTFFLGASAALFKTPDRPAMVIGLICGAAFVALMFQALAARAGGVGVVDKVIIVVGAATSPILIFWSASGMDTVLFTLLITGALLSALDDHKRGRISWRTALLLLLATSARMEGLLLAGYVGVWFLLRRRPILPLFAFGLAVAAGLVVRYLYYGSWLPNTFHAKVTVDLWSRISSGASYLLSAVRCHTPLIAASVIISAIALRQRGQPSGILQLVRQNTEAHAGKIDRGRRESENVVSEPRFFIGWIALWSAYVLYAGGDNFAAFRFLLPVMPAVLILIAWMIASVRRDAVRCRWFCTAVLSVGLVGSHILVLRSEAHHQWMDMALAESWANTGRWLRRSTPPDAVIATPVPGAMGYFSQRTTIDMLGLTDRTVAQGGDIFPHAAHGHSRYHTDYIFERDPDYVVYLSSGRYETPLYASPHNISRRHAYALYDFVSDPRCASRYVYRTAELPDGTIVEMQQRRSAAAASLNGNRTDGT